MNLWERFDNIVKPEEIEEVQSTFTPIEAGKYRMILEEISPSETKETRLPMLKGKFRIIENNRVVFYNQVLQNLTNERMTAVNVAEAVNFINGLLGEEIEFTGLGALAELVNTIPIGTEHYIEVSYGAKDVDKKFAKLKVVQDEELPPLDSFHPTDEDIAF